MTWFLWLLLVATLANGVVYALSERRYRQSRKLNDDTREHWNAMIARQNIERNCVIIPRKPTQTELEQYIQAGTVSASEEIDGALRLTPAACICLPSAPDFACPVHYPKNMRD